MSTLFFGIRVVLALAPAVFFAWMLGRQGHWSRVAEARPSDGRLGGSITTRAFAAGVLGVPIAIIAESLIGGLGGGFRGLSKNLFSSFMTTGLVEELVKAVIVRALVFRLAPPRNLEYGLRLGAVAGLGFASLENFFYSIEDPWLLAFRSVSSVPLHLLTGVISSWGLTRARLRPGSSALPWIILAALVHGSYNFFLLLHTAYLAVACLLAGGAIAATLLRRAVDPGNRGR